MKKRRIMKLTLLVISMLLVVIILQSNTHCAQKVMGKEAAYTVVFYANGGKGTMKTQTIGVSKKVSLKKCTFYRNGYIFQGWALSKTGKVKYKNNAKVQKLSIAGKNVKLYAKWKKAGKRRGIALVESSTPAVPKLDAESTYAMMKNSKFYGKKMDKLVLYPDHTKAEIEKKMKTLFKNNTSMDISYIYMSCHGDKKGNIYIGSDGTYFSTSELRKFCDENIQGTVVLMLDCCFSEMVIASSIKDTEFDFSEKFVTDFMSIDENNEKGLTTSKYKVICSSRKKETSWGGEISLATKYWNKGTGWISVSKEKCKLYADSNADKKVSLKELYKYSYKKVLNENPRQHVTVYPKNSSFIIFGKFDY